MLHNSSNEEENKWKDIVVRTVINVIIDLESTINNIKDIKKRMIVRLDCKRVLDEELQFLKNTFKYTHEENTERNIKKKGNKSTSGTCSEIILKHVDQTKFFVLTSSHKYDIIQLDKDNITDEQDNITDIIQQDNITDEHRLVSVCVKISSSCENPYEWIIEEFSQNWIVINFERILSCNELIQVLNEKENEFRVGNKIYEIICLEDLIIDNTLFNTMTEILFLNELDNIKFEYVYLAKVGKELYLTIPKSHKDPDNCFSFLKLPNVDVSMNFIDSKNVTFERRSYSPNTTELPESDEFTYIPRLSERLNTVFVKSGLEPLKYKNKYFYASHRYIEQRRVSESKGVIYKIPCKDCGMVYIGNTENLDSRLKQHQRDVDSQTESKCALAVHAKEYHHSFDFSKNPDEYIIEREPNKKRRQMKEFFYIYFYLSNSCNKLFPTKNPTYTIWCSTVTNCID